MLKRNVNFAKGAPVSIDLMELHDNDFMRFWRLAGSFLSNRCSPDRLGSHNTRHRTFSGATPPCSGEVRTAAPSQFLPKTKEISLSMSPMRQSIAQFAAL